MTDSPPQAPLVDPDDEGQESRGFWGSAGAAVRELVVVAVMAVVLSLVIKTWLAQAFFIPSGSMEQTLQVRDRVMVSKLHKSIAGIHRGDIVVFRDPGGWVPASADPEPRGEIIETLRSGLTFVGLLPDPADEHLIKRVIGVSGDRVVCCDAEGRLSVNGAPIVEPYVSPGDAPSALRFDITVPQDALWVMGDHRSDSKDSRYHPLQGDGSQGSVPLDLVVGRAVVTVWPPAQAGPLSNHAEVFSAVPAP